MKPLDIYELGMRLAESAASDAERRNAIGRLYYGLHHEACCRYFRENPQSPPLGARSRHRQLIERYDILPATGSWRIRDLLSQLFSMRNISDYKLAEPVRYLYREYTLQELLETAVRVAETALAALENFSPGPAEDGCVCPT